MIKTVIFDIGRVLLGFEWYDYIYSIMDKETADIATEAMWGTGYWHEIDRAVIPIPELLEMFYSAAPDYKDAIKLAFDRVGECVRKYDYPVTWIKDLKERGYQVLYLSNMSEYVMGEAPDAFDFLEHMDGGVFSCDVKLIKPDPAIYQVICDKYDLNPAECIFIDDNAANIKSANEFGLNTVLFESYEQAHAELEDKLAAL